jgi:hypothetical protein
MELGSEPGVLYLTVLDCVDPKLVLCRALTQKKTEPNHISVVILKFSEATIWGK